MEQISHGISRGTSAAMNSLCLERQTFKSMIYSQVTNGNAPNSLAVLSPQDGLPQRLKDPSV